MDIDIKNIEETPHLLSILLEIEDVLDSMDIYVFRNWLNGEIVEGPTITRYWAKIVLKYEYKKMPDPRAGMRLLKHGVTVEFEKADQEKIDQGGEEGDTEKVWLVSLSIPRKLLNGMNDASTDFYDDEIDIDDVESAKDMGVDDDTAYEQEGEK